MRPYLKGKNNHRKHLVGSRVVQGVDPEFKPQYHQQIKKNVKLTNIPEYILKASVTLLLQLYSFSNLESQNCY
jgi:hypothetical protein